MTAELTQWILDAIRFHGGWSVFVGVLIEQVIIPIPSPAIIMGAGAIMISPQEPWAAMLWKMSYLVVVPGAVATLLGSVLLYYIGMWGGKTFIDRFHKYLGFTWRDVEWVSHTISQRGVALTVFSLRAIPIVPISLISLVGGLFEIPLKNYLTWTFLGTVARCYFLGILGWLLGSSAQSFASGVNRFESVVSVVVVVAVALAVVWVRKKIAAQSRG